MMRISSNWSYTGSVPVFLHLAQWIGLIAPLLLLVSSHAASATPIIFNQPFSAKPGDVISVTGTGFGSAPQVFFKSVHESKTAQLAILRGQSTVAVFQVPATQSIDTYEFWISDGATSSAHAYINMPRAMQFSGPDIAPGQYFRIWGRNLYLNGATPRIYFIDVATNSWLAPVTPDFTGPNDAYQLYFKAPNGIAAGKTYQVVVTNTFGSATADSTLLGHAAGTDAYGVGQAWGSEFIAQNGPGYQAGVAGTNENDHHVYDVTSDPSLSVHAKGDGVTDATWAIQLAINTAASHGGGLVYLPAGTYRLASPIGVGLTLKSGVMLRGHSAADTKIVYGPTTPQGSSYQFFAIYWPPGTSLSGIADLSLQNVDKTSQVVVSTTVNHGSVSKIALLRVNWDEGSGQPIFMQGDRVMIRDCTITQSPNNQVPYSDGASGLGPINFGQVSNLSFLNNTVSWFSGQNLMDDMTNVVIDGNHFTRNADQMVATAAQTSWPYVTWPWPGKPIAVGDVIERTPGRQMSINFGNRIVVENNIFDTAGAVMKFNWDDGETFLSEGGGASPRSDAGTATSATSLTITDDSRGSSGAWNYNPNSVVSVVSGAGAGQIRNIVSNNNNTFTIDRSWDVIPSSGDHFAIDVPSLQNALITYNNMSGNRRGIVLYTGTFLNTSIIENSMTDNGGVLLRPDQYVMNGPNGAQFHFGRMRNIEVNRNKLTNSSGLFDSYIFLNFALISPTTLWGASVDGIEMRGNSIAGFSGTPIDDAPADGYFNYVAYHNPNADFVDQGVNTIVGTVMQNNVCTSCSPSYTLSTGDLDTVIWNATSTTTSAVAATSLSQLISDKPIWKTAIGPSVGTVVGP
ncbi:glycosyl hydrolase family 28-related protein [Methylocapsa acidiphila]|uniref:glycosyl hydrolase family 28-related protein n=1 Tax=Methylocapsa acidiphila TaxID=133552 RepID=UPI0018DB31EF|nr:glycosyl hydrolase family 28-related protein [Methylocapsa acidiphila]